MKNDIATTVSILATLMGLSTGNAAGARARFEPEDGKVLLIMGQNVEEIQAYLKAAKVMPGGLMAYTSLNKLEGLSTPYNAGDGTQHAQKLVDDYPQSAIQIGLYLVDQCDAILQGKKDASIQELASWLKTTHRPVFLRIGYEFDGPHNHYPPEAYVGAYRYMVDRFRQSGITNVAYVWHSFASKSPRPVGDWYPGDEYVDWVGISYFDQPQSYMQPAVDFAQAHQKPIMIGESSAWKHNTRYANAWNLWFAPYLKFIEKNKIKAISYISSDWDTFVQFKSQRWGDTRVQSHPEILQKWLAETAKDRYLKSSPTLFQELGFEKSDQ